MEQIKLVSRDTGSFALVDLETEANEWLKDNADTEILGISIISYPSEPQHGEMGRMGWIIMIRFRKS